MSAPQPSLNAQARVVSDLIADVSHAREHIKLCQRELDTATAVVKTKKANLETAEESLDKLLDQLEGKETLDLFHTPGITGIEPEQLSQETPAQEAPAQEEPPALVPFSFALLESMPAQIQIARGEQNIIISEQDAAQFTSLDDSEFATYDSFTTGLLAALQQKEYSAIEQFFLATLPPVVDAEAADIVDKFFDQENGDEPANPGPDDEPPPVIEPEPEPEHPIDPNDDEPPVKVMRKPDGSVLLKTANRIKVLYPDTVANIEAGGARVYYNGEEKLFQGNLDDMADAQLHQISAALAQPYDPSDEDEPKPKARKKRNIASIV